MIIFSYNPKKSLFDSRLTRVLPFKKRLNNFGDLLGPIIVSKLLQTYKLKPCPKCTNKTLFTVGSILHFAKDNDIVWGAGRNGKVLEDRHTFSTLDVRATRGPMTRDFLKERGIQAPSVYGDPALLLPELFPELRKKVTKTRGHIFIPNYNDHRLIRSKIPVISPNQSPWKVIDIIRESEFVSASSLHGIILAEALGVPCRVVRSRAENTFKYLDYFLGTGRQDIDFANDPEGAEEMGGHEHMIWSPDRLLSSFPYDLF